MKKVLSMSLAFIMLVSCMALSSFSALANTQATAIVLEENQPIAISLDNTQENKCGWYKFTPSKTGFYEFVLDGKVINGELETSICDSKKQIENFGFFDNFTDGAYITAAKLTANKAYYFMIDGKSNAYTSNLVVQKHNHVFEDDLVIPAYYDTEFNGLLTMDGGVYQMCSICLDTKQIATYYYPKNMTLSKSAYTSDGKEKKPTVTIKDRKGNVINKSNYKLTYKNNKKAGKATVKLTFNDKKYSGTFTKTFIIKPKQAALTSAKRAGYGKASIKWKKDSEASGYQVQYSTDKNFKKNNKTVTVKKNATTSASLSKLSNKKYYVRVRAYKVIDKKNTYGAWSKAKSM